MEGLEASAPFRARPMARGLKRSEAVARDVARTIIERAMRPGSPLPTEALMTKQYGVARSTLREALRILEVYGLVSVSPGRTGGPRVEAVDASKFGSAATFYYSATGATYGELAEARILLEPQLAKLAAERRTPETCVEMGTLLDLTRTLTDPEMLVEVNKDFHALVGRMSGNVALALVGASYEEIFHSYAEAETARDTISPLSDIALEAHEEIAEAILAEHASEAEDAMRSHLELSMKHLRKTNPSLMARVVNWTR